MCEFEGVFIIGYSEDVGAIRVVLILGDVVVDEGHLLLRHAVNDRIIILNINIPLSL